MLVLLNGFFVAAEFALVEMRDTQSSPLDREGQPPRQGRARHILAHLDAFLSAAQLGITLASLAGLVGRTGLHACSNRCFRC